MILTFRFSERIVSNFALDYRCDLTKSSQEEDISMKKGKPGVDVYLVMFWTKPDSSGVNCFNRLYMRFDEIQQQDSYLAL